MTASAEHLAKANQFLEGAVEEASAGRYDVAVSLAITAVVQAGDAVCMEVLGERSNDESHTGAVRLLRRAGPSGDAVLRQMQAVLKLKKPAQYMSERCTRVQANDAVRRATRAVAAATNSLAGSR